MLYGLAYTAACALLGLLARWGVLSAAEVELLALRHEARTLRRTGGRGAWRPADRLVLAALSRRLPRRGWCQLTAVSAPGLCGQDAPRSGVTIRRSSSGSDTRLVIGDQPAAGERPSVGSGHACAVAGTSWWSSRWARR